MGKYNIRGANMGIKEKLSIEKITKDDYRDWLLYKHYAKRIPLIKYAFGLYLIFKSSINLSYV